MIEEAWVPLELEDPLNRHTKAEELAHNLFQIFRLDALSLSGKL